MCLFEVRDVWRWELSIYFSFSLLLEEGKKKKKPNWSGVQLFLRSKEAAPPAQHVAHNGQRRLRPLLVFVPTTLSTPNRGSDRSQIVGGGFTPDARNQSWCGFKRKMKRREGRTWGIINAEEGKMNCVCKWWSLRSLTAVTCFVLLDVLVLYLLIFQLWPLLPVRLMNW